ncbi:hypothetical protein N8I77_000159 [Diaporthe amygdali]|uniref:Amidase domain-containing protein n=1 Tax=Phomopsis amygdali TaxID=1214568 RepID=A0AAD9SQB5_PHOAM|nr:hypothetical protein N8I77_000159 [Diaporthe amygdali]
MVDIEELTIAQAHSGFRRGDFTAKELTAAFLARIDKFDHAGPKINAMMALSTTALQEAAQLDDHLNKTGQLKGSLHGIPIVVKDQADTKGIVTTYGSAAAKNNIPTQDAFVVTKLKQAGAVIIGKTTMAEWACAWYSANGATDYTFTKNPYNLDHDVGASSGGSAAAVAANFAILAVAEDTGGSIRVPSSFCNIVGLRPTPGLISRAGFCPLLKLHDTPGPMARTVTDCALMLDSMVGFDPRDEYTEYAATAAAIGLPKGGSYSTFLEDGPEKLNSAKFGVVRQLFGSERNPDYQAVCSVTASAMDKLQRHGTTFVDVHIDNLNHYLSYTQTYMIKGRTDINSFLATKPNLPSDIADIVPSNQVRPWLDLLSLTAHGPQDPTSDATYVDRILTREAFKRKVCSIIASQGLDALIFPDAKIPPPRAEDATSGKFPTESFPVNTFFASQACLPAISVPAGFTQEGLPVGLELVGLEHQEQHLLELARGIEVVIGGRKAPEVAVWV